MYLRISQYVPQTLVPSYLHFFSNTTVMILDYISVT